MRSRNTGRKVEFGSSPTGRSWPCIAKTGKLLDGRRACEAQAWCSPWSGHAPTPRRRDYYGHQLVGTGASADLFTSIHSAAERNSKRGRESAHKMARYEAHAAQIRC